MGKGLSEADVKKAKQCLDFSFKDRFEFKDPPVDLGDGLIAIKMGTCAYHAAAACVVSARLCSVANQHSTNFREVRDDLLFGNKSLGIPPGACSSVKPDKTPVEIVKRFLPDVSVLTIRELG